MPIQSIIREYENIRDRRRWWNQVSLDGLYINYTVPTLCDLPIPFNPSHSASLASTTKLFISLYCNYNTCLFIMKAATLITLFAQVAYVFSMPAAMEEDGVETSTLEDRQVEVPDSLTSRGNCWYKDHPNAGPVTCSKSGWCFGRCNLQAQKEGSWCWYADNLGTGAWTACKSQADCSIAIARAGNKRAWCRGGCHCE